MKTPYADLLIGFQEALDKYAKHCEVFGVAKDARFRDGGKILERARAAKHSAGVLVQQKFNEVLTDLQELREGKVTRVGKPRSKRCFFCGRLEDKTKAHLMVGDGTRKWVCDGCWDERLRD